MRIVIFLMIAELIISFSMTLHAVVNSDKFAELAREKNKRIRVATQDMFQTSIVTAEYFHTESNIAEQQLWNNLLKTMSSETFKHYLFEVHYINIKTHSLVEKSQVMDEAQRYNFADLGYQNTASKDSIISIVIMRPDPQKTLKKGTAPIGIFSHGGSPNNLQRPSHKNPIFTALVQLGYALVIPNYRGGLAENHLLDMRATIAYISTLEFADPTKIVLTGISEGTALNTQILESLASKNNKYPIKGAFLHTGFYGRSEVIDAMEGISADVPIFLASGMLDSLTDSNATLHCIRELDQRSRAFSYFLADKGGHQLISPIETIEPYPIENKAYTSKQVQEIVKHISKRYNAEEIMDYSYHLVEFLDSIAYGQLPNIFQNGLNADNQINIARSTIIQAKMAQGIKGVIKNQPVDAGTIKVRASLMNAHGGLENAEYAPSQAQLKIILEKQHSNKSDHLERNISRFLQHYDCVKSDIFSAYEKKLSADAQEKKEHELLIAEKLMGNDEVKKLIKKILSYEEVYKGNYVLYHGTEAKIGFIYDLYSALRRMLSLAPNAQDNTEHYLSRLRLLDDAFEKIMSATDLIRQMKLKEGDNPNTLFNNLPGYQDVGISAHWFLFGSYKYWFNSTFFKYFRKSQSASSVSLETILKSFFRSIGITDAKVLGKLIETYVALYRAYVDPKNGRLLQIFVSPEVIDEIAYVSETGGYPLELDVDGAGVTTHAPSQIISMALKDPMAFEKTLKSNRKNFLHQILKDREEFSEEKPGLKYVNSVEARMFMKPEYIDDPTKVQIVSHSLIKPKNAVEYKNSIEENAYRTLEIWLENKPKLSVAMIHKKPALVRLREYIEEGLEKSAHNLHKKNTIHPDGLHSVVLSLTKLNKLDELEFIKKNNTEILSNFTQEKRRENSYNQISSNTELMCLINSSGAFDDKQASELVRNGANINTVDAGGYSILYYALKQLDFKKAQWLVDRGAHVDTKNKVDEPILLSLFLNIPNREHAIRAMEFVIKNGANVNARYGTENGNPVIYYFLRNEKETDIVGLLVNNGADIINATNIHEDSLLEGMVFNRRWDINTQKFATWLKSKGADINLPEGGCPALYWRIRDKNFEHAAWLIEQRANINALCEDDDSPILLRLLMNGYFEGARWLIDKGADINARTRDGDPILDVLLQRGDLDAARILLNNKNININARNQYGNHIVFGLLMEKKIIAAKLLASYKPEVTPRLFEAIKGNQDYSVFLNYVQSIKVKLNTELVTLMLSGRSLNDIEHDAKELQNQNACMSPYTNGIPLLYTLLKQKKFDKAEWLLQHGADPNQRINGKYPILLELILNTNDENETIVAADLLSRYGFNTDATLEVTMDGNKITTSMLTWLCVLNKKKVVEWLVRKGVNRNTKDSSGTPILLRLISMKKWDNIEEFLEIVAPEGEGISTALVNANTSDGTPILLEIFKKEDGDELREILNWLLKRGVNVNARTRDGRPILFSLLNENEMNDALRAKAELLVEKGAHINTTVNLSDGSSQLLELLWNNKLKAAEFLLDNHANRNATLFNGEHPLGVLLHQRKMEAAKVLLRDLGSPN